MEILRSSLLMAGICVLALSVQAQKAELKEVYYPNGKLQYKGHFIGKEPVGEVVQYYTDGNIKARLNYQGQKTEAVIFSKNGEFTFSGAYLNQQKEGPWVYKKGERILTKEHYHRDILDGEAIKYYASGDVAEIKNWEQGRLSGPWKIYYGEGKLRFEASYADGILEGPLKSYDYQGQLRVEGLYKNGCRSGLWRYYDAAGKITKERSYTNGVSDEQPEELIEENEMFIRIEQDSRKVADPFDFIEEPEIYLKLTE